jgi:hypothetical protein
MNRSNSNNCYCKVCHDAKKPETVYKSHFVKNKEGVVVCPTLLSQECKYCFKSGHTVKYCPILLKRAKDDERSKRRAESQKTVQEPVKANKVVTNKFDLLFEDDELMQEQLPVHKMEEFPCLGQSSSAAAPLSYKSIISRTVEDQKRAEEDVIRRQIEAKNETYTIFQVVPEPPKYQFRSKVSICDLNWAQMEDSDEDEDEPIVFEDNTNADDDDEDW